MKQRISLNDIDTIEGQLFWRFQDRFAVSPYLSRFLVSFQGNRDQPIYRWYKFKEAFSASLVEHLFRQHGITTGRVLDPFAGSGTTLFVASMMGIHADGIELLPVGQEVIKARKLLMTELTAEDFERLGEWAKTRVWERSEDRVALPELRITRMAYPDETREAIEKYLAACERENERVRAALRFALLCVLESVSFTSKDGQFLRWDYRSGRAHGKVRFDKGYIPDFGDSVSWKIKEILVDVSPAHRSGLFPLDALRGEIRLYGRSCLDILPALPDGTYDAVMTSPPYCNRYNYTRTYALELALLGMDERRLAELHQEMLSCTVENRTKDLLGIRPQWERALAAADEQTLLQAILGYLEDQKARGKLNNSGIPKMVRNYFREMACVVSECARVLKPGALLFMVNDNVRYAGASIPVDIILSDIAEKLGFAVESILVLPDGKGNSIQQMKRYRKKTMRKCVYVWRKL